MTLTTEEASLIEQLNMKRKGFIVANGRKIEYYKGKNAVKDLGISLPPRMRAVKAVVGWAATCVDVLNERIEFKGYYQPNDAFGLDKIFRQNNLETEARFVHEDALITGSGYVVIGQGDESIGEPKVLITVESPNRMTANWDARNRRLTSALSVVSASKELSYATLYLPDVTINLVSVNNGRWVEESRDEHNLGFVPVVKFTNRPSSTNPYGSSEITRAAVYYIDAAMRTLLGVETLREFFSAPQRYVMGAPEDAFKDEDGNPINPWSAVMGRMLAMPTAEEGGQLPTVGQFPANSPEPFISQMRHYASLFAAEAAIPSSYMGLTNEANPTSADAIRAMEARLLKRAQDRISQFGRSWTEVARMALLIQNDGAMPEGWEEVRAKFANPSTPTSAASADRMTKLISAGIFTQLYPDLVYRELEFDDTSILEIKKFLKEQQNTSLIESLIAQNTPAEEIAQALPEVIVNAPAKELTV